MESTLLMRATQIAKASGASLELFHASHDSSIDQRLFASDEGVVEQRTEIANDHVTCLSEIALNLQSQGIVVNYDARWDEPEADALLRKIDQSSPDLVMRASQKHRFFFGLMRHTDWDLIRRSPVDLWFVGDDRDAPSAVISAIGSADHDEDIIPSGDYQVFHLAGAERRTYRHTYL